MDEMTPVEKVATSVMYGGKYDQTCLEMMVAGLITTICISFPDMHSAASWAMTNSIEHHVNILFHPVHFDEPLIVRYASKGE